MSSLGSRLKEARKEAGFSLMDVENKIGVSNGYLSQLERDKKKNPSMKLLKKLSNLYNVPLSYFVASEKTLDILTESEREYFEESLQNDKIRSLIRQARGLTDRDLARIISIAKEWNEENKPEKEGDIND